MKRLREWPWLRWLKHLLVSLHFLLIWSIVLSSAVLYVAYRPDGMELVNRYVFEPAGIRYERAEGSLIGGFTLYNLRTGGMEASTLALDYNLTRILQGEHIIDSLKVSGVRITLDDFSEGGGSSLPFPTFAIRKIELKNIQIVSAYPIEFDLYGTRGSYNGDRLDFDTVTATVKSRYAGAAIKGSIRNNVLSGSALLYPDLKELDPYVGHITALPRAVPVTVVGLSTIDARLTAQIPGLFLKSEPELHAEDISVRFSTRFDADYFDVNGTYSLRYKDHASKIVQNLRYRYDGLTESRLSGEIASTLPLPSQHFEADFSDHRNTFKGKIDLGDARLQFHSSDYSLFDWNLSASFENTLFLKGLPELLGKEPLKLSGRGTYRIDSASTAGTLEIDHPYQHFRGSFVVSQNQKKLEGNVTLPSDAPLWAQWSLKPPEHFSLSLSDGADASRVQIDGEGFDLSGTLSHGVMRGSGNYLGAYFEATGTLGDHENALDIETVIPSLFSTVSRLHPIEMHKGEYYDAEVKAKTRITMSDKLAIESDIRIPWYAAVVDSQRSFGGTDGSLKVRFDGENITIDRYRLEIADHPISTDKPSRIVMKPDGGMEITELWLYDTLRLQGTIRPDTSASLRLLSDRFSYKGPEGEAHARADVTYTRSAEGDQQIGGNIEVLDALITYLPLQQFKVMDDDIIIIQDVRPPSQSRLSMNLHVTSREPLRYRTKELNLLLTPDITLWREPAGPMQILGMVTIPSGTAVTTGKTFDIRHSEIYFGGDVPLNPYLNLTIGHEVDYKKITIYVTHTLDSPIFLFNSDPVMSQNDIMSYILFGSPANAALNSDGSSTNARADATNFMLGAGIKGLINGATKIQLDTMNILTTEEGGMGFEVGARLNKDLRVLYKNDTVSSVLIQYTVNRWLRLDVDIRELGQGISAIYVKDFRDFLPHNPPKKKP